MPAGTVFPHKYILFIRRSGANAWSWERRSWRQSARSWIWLRRRRKKTKKMKWKRTRSTDHSCNCCLIQTCKLKTTWQYNPVFLFCPKFNNGTDFGLYTMLLLKSLFTVQKSKVLLEVKKIFWRFFSIDRWHRRPWPIAAAVAAVAVAAAAAAAAWPAPPRCRPCCCCCCRPRRQGRGGGVGMPWGRTRSCGGST